MPATHPNTKFAPGAVSGSLPDNRIRPREARSRIETAGRMYGDYSPDQPVSVRDISQFGLGGEVSEIIPDIGERVTIELDTGDILHGEIRWTDGLAFGVRLSDPFHPDKIREVTELRERLIEQAREG